MKKADQKYFHKLYGVKRPRIFYQKKDFFDYTIMTFISAFVIYFSYGYDHLMSKAGIVLSAFMIASFLIRHGFEFKTPLILRRPQDVLYMIVYKIQNITPVYFFALGLLVLENYLIYLTPGLPHKVGLMREIAFYLFYLHFISILIYRTIILIDHLRKRELVREVLMQTNWKKFISKRKNITLEIIHAYFTGILTHIVLIAPWYIVVKYFNFSIIFIPVIILINVFVQLKYFQLHNAWFYRDHWLGHNSEIEFLYLHGTHHDAIPCSLIGVAGNGHLEGFMRHILGFPTQFFNPIVSFLFFTYVVKQDIDAHQYVPGIFPKLTKDFHKVAQHSTHHFGHLEPYSFGLRFDEPGVSEGTKKGYWLFPDELRNSIRLDEILTGFKWDNPAYKRYLDLFDRYQK